MEEVLEKPEIKSRIKNTISMVPPDRIFEELGKNTYTDQEAVCELIDNAISARIGGEVNIRVQFVLNEKGDGCDRLIVSDDASGIREKDIKHAFNLADITTENSLNEHGLGFKQSISALGTLDYFRSRHKGEEGFEIKSQSLTVDVYEIGCDFPEHGTEISISDLKNSSNIKKSHFKQTTLPKWESEIGSVYRHFLTRTEEDINITIELLENNGDTFFEKKIKAIQPYYFNPFDDDKLNEAIVKGKEFVYGNAKAVLDFGYCPKTENEYKRIGEKKENYTKHWGSGKHKYRSHQDTAGIDIIMNDRVICFHQLEQIGLVSTRGIKHSQIKGELFLYNVATTTTKNGIVDSEEFRGLLGQIDDYLSKKTNREGDSIRCGGYNNLVDNTYLQGEEAIKEQKEKVIKDKLETVFNGTYGSLDLEVEREAPIEGTTLQVDFRVGKKPIEVKKGKAEPKDIAQLLLYCILEERKSGELTSNGYTDGCQYIIKKIEEVVGIKLELKDLTTYLQR